MIIDIYFKTNEVYKALQAYVNVYQNMVGFFAFTNSEFYITSKDYMVFNDFKTQMLQNV